MVQNGALTRKNCTTVVHLHTPKRGVTPGRVDPVTTGPAASIGAGSGLGAIIIPDQGHYPVMKPAPAALDTIDGVLARAGRLDSNA